jgi:RNA polymerase sigma-70 factor (ECF subfamily)
MSARSVAQLVDRSRGGDQEAFGQLVDCYRDMVYGLAFHLTGSFEEARDLTQEAFVQAYLKLGQLREPAKFGAWLRQITVNLYRTQARTPTVATVPLGEEAEAVPQAQPSEIEAVVREALGRLREAERLALTLHYINGYSQAEIGAFLGVDAGTVKGRLARARRHLREEVMQMVEDVFDRNALPAEFAQDVIRAVNGLVTNLRAALPPDLDDVCRRLHKRRNESWRAVLAKVPETLLPRPLPEQGEARAMPVASLPEDLRREARAAACLTWYEVTTATVDRAFPWVHDLEVLHVCFFENAGQWAWLGDAPGVSKDYSVRIPIGLDAADVWSRGRGSPAGAAAICPQPPELRGTFRQLRRALPGRSGSLANALYATMAALLRQAREQLPAEAGAAMAAGHSVSVRDLPEPVRDLLRRAVHLHWGSDVLAAVESPPSWVAQFESGTIEFGIYPEFEGLEKYWGQEYVTILGPFGRAGAWIQTGVGEALDDCY